MKEPIRILQLGMTTNPGGTESFIMNVYRNIDKSKVQFDFLIPHDSAKIAYEDEIKALGGKIYRMYYMRRERNLEGAITLEELFHQHKEWKGVHYNCCAIDTRFRVLLEAKKHNVPMIILHSHNSMYMSKPNWKKKLYEIYARANLKRVTTNLFACSKEAGEWMFHKNAYTVLNNAIQVAEFQYEEAVREKKRKELGIEDKWVIGSVGRFQYQKNTEFIVDIFYELQKEREDAVLILVGDGDLKESVQARIKHWNLEDKVQLLGSRDDVAQLYQAMDVFLFPSRFEGFGIVLVEAQVSGLPCFTSKDVVPATVEVTELLKFISLENTAKAWASEILNFDYSKRISQEKKVIEKGFDIQQLAKQLEKIYLQEM